MGTEVDEREEREKEREKIRRREKLLNEGFTQEEIEKLEDAIENKKHEDLVKGPRNKAAKEDIAGERQERQERTREEVRARWREAQEASDGERVIPKGYLSFNKNRARYLINAQKRESEKSKSEDQAAKPQAHSTGRRLQHKQLITASNNKSADSAEKNSVSYTKETKPYTNIARVKQSSLQSRAQSQATKTSEYHNAEALSSNTTVELDNNQDETTTKKLRAQEVRGGEVAESFKNVREQDYRRNQNSQAKSEDQAEKLNDSCSERPDCSAILNPTQNSYSESDAIEMYFDVDSSDDEKNNNQNIAETTKQRDKQLKKDERAKNICDRFDKMEPIFINAMNKLLSKNKEFKGFTDDQLQSIFDDAHKAGYYTGGCTKLPLDETQNMRADDEAILMRQFSKEFQRASKRKSMNFSDAMEGKTNKAGMRTKSFNNFINGKYRSVDTSNTIK